MTPWLWCAGRSRVPRPAATEPSQLSRLAASLTGLPLVGAVLGLLTQVVLYFTPYFEASLRSGAVRTLVWVNLLVVGALFTLPLLDEGRETAGGGQDRVKWGGRVLLAFADGLLDAVPGMVIALSGFVVAGGWYASRASSGGLVPAYDQLLGGELMVGISEAVGVPLIFVACVMWARADTGRAAAVDAELDEQERMAAMASGTVGAASPGEAGRDAPDARPDLPDGTVRPWWEEQGGPWGRR